jgi:hypothetical protein
MDRSGGLLRRLEQLNAVGAAYTEVGFDFLGTRSSTSRPAIPRSHSSRCR